MADDPTTTAPPSDLAHAPWMVQLRSVAKENPASRYNAPPLFPAARSAGPKKQGGALGNEHGRVCQVDGPSKSGEPGATFGLQAPDRAGGEAGSGGGNK